ncbi:MAG: lipid A 4'-phosphatase [Pseudoalteromonas tetraodonis]|jgi:lipid A 4'-phosphatase
MARPSVDFVFPGVLLAALTAVFFFLPIDLAVEGWFYAGDRGGWFLKDAKPLVMIYDKGLIPALCVVVTSIVVLIIGFRRGTLQRYRKIAIYLLLVMVIAPGLLVNAIMKEGWGRPRPRQVEHFGGEEAFERVWEYDGSSYGKSFPSGHAAMGFYFFGAYFLLRRWGRRSILLWLGVALGLGGLLGFTRMAQGGHFPSDVLWSAGVCYFVAGGLYYAMGLHRGLWYTGGKMSKGALAGVVVALLGIAALGVGTPYHEEKAFTVDAEVFRGAETLRVKLELPRANLRISGAEEFGLESEAEGFGSPGSRLEDRFESLREGGKATVSLRQKKSGFFATAEQPMKLGLPRGLVVDADVVVEKGVVTLELDDDSRGFWDFDLGDVALRIYVPDGLDLKMEYADGVEPDVENVVDGLEFDPEKLRWKRGNEPAVRLRLRGIRGGSLFFGRTDSAER